MNPHRVFQLVPQAGVDRSIDFGNRLVAWYASDEGRRSRSRSVSGNRGTERNPIRLAQGKIGEVAAALYFRLNPNSAVKWDVGAADAGYDLVLPDGHLIDVKTTFPPFNLIWSNTINGIYEDVRFDLLVSVSVAETDFSQCWLEGWISKKEFFNCKKIADGESKPRLEAGTWYLPKDDLYPVWSTSVAA